MIKPSYIYDRNIQHFTKTTFPNSTSQYPRGSHNPEKALIVYQNAKGNGEAAMQELLARARIVVPAIMNYLFFSTTHIAVLYLGKSRKETHTIGITEGVLDMKIRMIRYLTTEMWPPLLRTDAPDDSYVTDIFHSECSETFFDDMFLGDVESESHKRISLQLLKQFSLENKMDVLVYLKNSNNGTQYLKLILRNKMHRLHFDVIDPKDEKKRWEERKLFTRILDNLETRKAIPSFENYENFFREACAMSARLPVHHPLLGQLVILIYHSIKNKKKEENTNDNNSNSNETPFYRWMENLSRPESAMLDYKSYIFDTVNEIKYNCVRFMCGFLNAYNEGKLCIGVHEIPKRNSDGSIPPIGDGKNNIIRHDDLIDQYVVGVYITKEELMDIQQSLSKLLLECVPPVPPEIVHIELIPVKLPENFTMSKKILVLYDDEPTAYGAGIKQKLFSVMHYLVPIGLSLVPINSEITRQRLLKDEKIIINNKIGLGFYCVGAVNDPSDIKNLNWDEILSKAMEGSKVRCQCFIIENDPGDIFILPLNIIDISVDLKRSSYLPLRMFTGKFFTGWPSIPIWDTNIKTVRRVEKNYNIVKYFLNNSTVCTPVHFKGRESHKITFAVPGQFLSRTDISYKRTIQQVQSSWFNIPQVASKVLSFLGDIFDCLRFRLLHSVCDLVFERRQGNHLIQLLLSTPLGNLDFSYSWSHISWMQNEMHIAGIPPMPLLLCRVFESIGSFPSPFPYISVPLTQQSFRVSKYLIPLFYIQSYFDGQMKPSIVLDIRDGIVKIIRLQNGNFILSSVIGVGFEQITKRQMNQFLIRRRMSLDGSLSWDTNNSINMQMHGFLTPPSLRPISMYDEIEMDFLLPSPSNNNNNNNLKNDKVIMLPREVEEYLPILSFKFLTEENMNEMNFISFSQTSSPNDENTIIITNEKNDEKRMPWTLSHLLSWFNILSSDTHVQNFGYCKRSLSYRIASLRDVCLQHVEYIEENNPIFANLRFADSPHHCLLHKKIDEWLSI